MADPKRDRSLDLRGSPLLRIVGVEGERGEQAILRLTTVSVAARCGLSDDFPFLDSNCGQRLPSGDLNSAHLPFPLPPSIARSLTSTL